MNAKFFGILATMVFLAVSLFAMSAVSAETWHEDNVDINTLRVYVDGNLVWSGRCYTSISPSYYNCITSQTATPALIRGETLPVKVVFTSNKDLGNIKLRIHINSYRNELVDKTVEFDVFKDNQYSKELFIKLPEDMDARDIYTLYVKLESRKELTGVDEARIDTAIQRVANQLDVLGVELLSNTVYRPGNNIYADVVVKNTGNHDVDDVFVKLSIKELGLSRTVYLGDLVPTDCSRCSKEDTQRISVVLSLPTDKIGTYILEAEAYNSELSAKAVKTIVVQNPAYVTILPQNTYAEASKGSSATYKIVVSNLGSTAETFSVETIGLNGWALSQVTPSLFTLGAGESRIVSVVVNVDEDANTGRYPFITKVSYSGTAKEMQFNTQVNSKSFDWGTALLILGIFLAVAIIVLLVVALMKNKKQETEEETPEAYY